MTSGKEGKKIPLSVYGGKPPCRSCPKVPKDAPKVPESAVELSVRNLRAVSHYWECRAVNSFPDDPIVRRNAAIIRRVEDEYDRMKQVEPLAMLFARLKPV